MKFFNIFCDGGLGNRFGTLFPGLYLAKRLDMKPIVHWPENNWCGASFHDIFSTGNIYHTNLGLNAAYEYMEPSTYFVIHEDQTKYKVRNKIYINSIKTIEEIDNLIENNLFFYTNNIPSFINERDLINEIINLKLNDRLVNEITDTIKKFNITKECCGINLRKTDYSSIKIANIDEHDAFEIIRKNRSIRYFINSDDINAEKLFLNEPNAIVNIKSKYVSQLINTGDWNSTIVDSEGRTFNYNVNRSREDVIEGFKDMIVLSRTNILTEGLSSYLKFAKLYKNVSF